MYLYYSSGTCVVVAVVLVSSYVAMMNLPHITLLVTHFRNSHTSLDMKEIDPTLIILKLSGDFCWVHQWPQITCFILATYTDEWK